MRAILVAVDYADLLAITLPYNRHHFDEVMVVTTQLDAETHAVAHDNDALVYTTSSFYDDGADFNKWKALEEGLDALGRDGWLCIMDADILWPRVIPPWGVKIGQLSSPLRRIHHDFDGDVFQEGQWNQLAMDPNLAEWAGYSQIFHAADPVLGPPPWHQMNWRHAGGADSFFHMKWPPQKKVRPEFVALHLGPPGINWCGRATEHIGGSKPTDGEARAAKLREYLFRRHDTRSFSHERLSDGPRDP